MSKKYNTQDLIKEAARDIDEAIECSKGAAFDYAVFLIDVAQAKTLVIIADQLCQLNAKIGSKKDA